MPTPLAQVDSSVGGKTGVTAAAGKNLIGAFHQPRAVVIDIATLETLPARELRAGYAEVVKYGLLGDAGFFEWLEANGDDVLQRDEAALSHAILTSCAAKARIVEADEHEAGQRALLNLGHTFAHAFEAVCGYDGRLLHGEAVGVGMVMAYRLAGEMGLCTGQDGGRAAAHISASGLATRLADIPAADASTPELIDIMRRDKKVRTARCGSSCHVPSVTVSSAIRCRKTCWRPFWMQADDGDLLSLILVILLLILASAFFSSAETALTAR